MNEQIDYRRWESIAAEFGVLEIAKSNRLMSRWRIKSEERHRSTRIFIREVHQENQKLALGIMRRVYSSTGGTDAEELREYPALEALKHDSDTIAHPQVPTHSEPFLDIDNVAGTFYPGLIERINTCYQLGINDATLILTRKLIENLLIDVLRRKYGTDRIEIYYDPDSSEFHSFYELIENFKELQSDFEHYSGEVDDNFIRELNSIRKPSNAEAHSIETDISDGEIENYQSISIYLVKVLFHIRNSL
ncbi:hypothetical protein [Halococcus agarilyticus]|uniref:hypothetical protein n=1 Tax=Halococcus agarilyticus TaxID=1232219 RepID=UPI0012AB7223|nr:hypothetical protein [Halococcus agarilyticus]